MDFEIMFTAVTHGLSWLGFGFLVWLIFICARLESKNNKLRDRILELEQHTWPLGDARIGG